MTMKASKWVVSTISLCNPPRHVPFAKAARQEQPEVVGCFWGQRRRASRRAFHQRSIGRFVTRANVTESFAPLGFFVLTIVDGGLSQILQKGDRSHRHVKSAILESEATEHAASPGTLGMRRKRRSVTASRNTYQFFLSINSKIRRTHESQTRFHPHCDADSGMSRFSRCRLGYSAC